MTKKPVRMYSAASLQDYVDCSRRFYLRHVRKLAWPAIESEPILENERWIQQGARFHQMVHRSLLGIPDELLTSHIQEPDLQRWWDQFQSSRKSAALETLNETASLRFPEMTLSQPLAGARLVAKCDLILARSVGEVLIYDWKTSRKRPARSWLAARLQTRVYPYLLARSSSSWNGSLSITPGQVKMIYWFADYPAQPEVFPYSSEQFQADERYLSGLIEEIAKLAYADFRPTEQAERCRFCVYRSYCDRGVAAGDFRSAADWEENDTPGEIGFDFDQVGEIAF
jgi:CRISPR/Cas system-associated exonuclease Cas4 (RecB family)